MRERYSVMCVAWIPLIFFNASNVAFSIVKNSKMCIVYVYQNGFFVLNDNTFILVHHFRLGYISLRLGIRDALDKHTKCKQKWKSQRLNGLVKLMLKPQMWRIRNCTNNSFCCCVHGRLQRNADQKWNSNNNSQRSAYETILNAKALVNCFKSRCFKIAFFTKN